MPEGQGENHLNMRVVRGSLYAKPRQRRTPTPEELDLDRELQEAFVAMLTPYGTVPSPGIQEIRQHKQRPWRKLGERLMEARRAKVAKARAKEISRRLDEWIDMVWGADDAGPRAA